MKNHSLALPILLLLGLIAGCDAGPKSGKGFVFPEGDRVRGHQAFVEMKCYTCHRVDGVTDLPAPTKAADKVVVLGGEVNRIRTYGDLVTAVIHPNDALTVRLPGQKGKDSPMPTMNDTMTVMQMLDIVTFLHARYTHLEPRYQPGYGP